MNFTNKNIARVFGADTLVKDLLIMGWLQTHKSCMDAGFNQFDADIWAGKIADFQVSYLRQLFNTTKGSIDPKHKLRGSHFDSM